MCAPLRLFGWTLSHMCVRVYVCTLLLLLLLFHFILISFHSPLMHACRSMYVCVCARRVEQASIVESH